MPSLFSVSAVESPGHPLLEDERGDALVLRVGVGLGEDERVVGDGGVRDPVLLAVEDVDVALLARRRQHGGDVGACGRLGEAEAGDLLPARLRREVALLLLLARVAEQRERVQPYVDGDQRAERRLAALDLLAGERLRDEVHSGPAVLLRDDDSEQPELGHSLDHGHVEVVVDVVLDRVRKHALVHELADGRLHLALLRSELEIHGTSVRGRLVDSAALRAEAGVRPVRRDRAARSTGRRSRVVRRLGKIALATALVLVLLALASGLVFAGSASHIAAGVEIAGVNVGGLTAEEAQARLEATARRYESVPVVFTAGGATFPLRPSDVEVRANWAAAAEEAIDRGDGPVPLRGLERLWLRATGTNVEPSVHAYQAALDYRLNQIATDVDEPAREAALVLDGLEPEVVPGHAGRELDQEAAGAVVVGALAAFERVETPLPVAVDRPDVTQQEMQAVAAQTRTVLSAPVKLTFSGTAVSVRPKQMARLLDLPSGGQTKLAIDEKAATRRLRNLSRGVARPPRNADFAVNANGRVRVVPSRAGRTLDVAATSAALLDAASRNDKPLSRAHRRPAAA